MYIGKKSSKFVLVFYRGFWETNTLFENWWIKGKTQAWKKEHIYIYIYIYPVTSQETKVSGKGTGLVENDGGTGAHLSLYTL